MDQEIINRNSIHIFFFFKKYVVFLQTPKYGVSHYV
jgi:hypothetical protein